MIDRNLVIGLLQQRYGTNISTAYYERIAEWRQWWCGQVRAFHTYRELGADQQIHERHLYTMKMAKKICEDWASMLLNEKTQITISDPKTSLFLQGKDGTGGVFGANNFWRCGNELIEKAFAVGTGAILARVCGAQLHTDGSMHGGKVALDFVEASCIIPLSVRQGQITEAAFVSEVLEKGKPYLYLETHVLENGKYVIQNEYYSAENGVLEKAKLPDGIAERLFTQSDIPWFAIIRPNIVNHYPHAHGLGQSIYADAIDALKGVDIAFNNFIKDLQLGGKKVFYNKSMLQTDSSGRTITPDDVAQSLFLQIDSDISFDTKAMVQEFNPSLRVEENKEAVQAQLNYLSFKCGLGTKHYQFDTEKMQTATEYVGSRQELIQNANKHYILIERALQSIVRAILYIGSSIIGADIQPEAEITIQFEDSYLIDKDSERERDRQDVRDGFRQAFEYRMRWFGEDEETAKRMVHAQEDTLAFGGDA